MTPIELECEWLSFVSSHEAGETDAQRAAYFGYRAVILEARYQHEQLLARCERAARSVC